MREAEQRQRTPYIRHVNGSSRGRMTEKERETEVIGGDWNTLSCLGRDKAADHTPHFTFVYADFLTVFLFFCAPIRVKSRHIMLDSRKTNRKKPFREV